jgi:hypothetical protein
VQSTGATSSERRNVKLETQRKTRQWTQKKRSAAAYEVLAVQPVPKQRHSAVSVSHCVIKHAWGLHHPIHAASAFY